MKRPAIACDIADKILEESRHDFSEEEREYLIRELRLKSKKDEDEAILTICQFVLYHSIEENRSYFEESLAREKKLIDRAIKRANRFQSSISSLGFRIKGEEGWQDYVLSFHKEIEKFKVILLKLEEENIPGSGRLANIQFDKLIDALVMLWKKEKGRWPGVSSQPYTDDTIASGKVYGPFVRFCLNIWMLFEDVDVSTVISAIRKSVRDLKNGKNLLRIK